MSFGRKKLDLLCGPTPLLYMPGMSRRLGIELYIKRDDMTPLGFGGNKLRKLEYLVADALDQGATTLLTMGGAQTNHGRLTAAVAARYGLGCHILSIDSYPGELSANLLLDRIMGATVTLRESDGRETGVQYDELAARERQRLEAAGQKVYTIPIGGSNALGALGYYDCALELAGQAEALGLAQPRVITAVGSMGTYLGLFCGFKETGAPMALTGVAIMPFGPESRERLLTYFGEVKVLAGLATHAMAEDFHIEAGYVRGGYNLPSEAVRKAILEVGRTDAVLLDPCYTGKAFAGLMDMVAAGDIAQGETVIFLHTGGLPGLYTRHHRLEFERELADGVAVERPGAQAAQ